MKLPLTKDMSNQEIAQVLRFVAGVLSLKETNFFRVRAYVNAAEVVAKLPQELKVMFVTNPNFEELPAIGEALEKKLIELFTTGDVKALQKYVKSIPAGTYPISQVHGIGVKRAYRLAKHFHLDNQKTATADLLKLAQANQLASLAGFGRKSQQDIIEAIQSQHQTQRIPYQLAKRQADHLIRQLITSQCVLRAEVMGSLRRQTKDVGDIDIGLVANDMGRVKETVKKMKSVKRVIVGGKQQLRLTLDNNWQVDMKSVPTEEWGSFLQHYTGSKEHNIKLRELALKKGLSLSEHGIKIKSEKKQLKFADETDFYHYLGLKWIDPQERIGGSEIEKAKL